MKTLYFINGTMGVGKTATCQILKHKLSNSIFLDGDWCWDMHPFQITEETKAMVMDNICHLLNNFLRCSVLDNIIFCWVMHEQAIIDGILARLDLTDVSLQSVSLICDEESLRKHLLKDIADGIRQDDIIERSISRMILYEELKTVKIDVSNITAEQAADEIIKL